MNRLADKIRDWRARPKRKNLYRRAIELYNQGNFEEALVHFEQVGGRQGPSFSLYQNLAQFYSGMTHCNLGIVHIYRGENEESIVHLRAAIECNPSDWAAYYYLGIAHNNLGQFETAMESFREVQNLNQDFLPVKLQIALVFFNETRYMEAQSKLEEIVANNPRWADMWYHLGLLKASMGQYENGLNDLEEALKINPDYLKARIMKGLLLAQTKQPETGAAALETVHEDRPHFPDVCYYLGLTYVAQGELDKAEQSLTKSLEINPNYVDALFVMAVLHAANQKYDQAESSLRRVIQLKKQHREALMLLQNLEQARLSEDWGAVKKIAAEALKQLPRQIFFIPDFSDIVHVFSPNSNIGLYRSLINFYKSAADRSPHFPDLHENLGALFNRLKEYDLAVEAYRKSLEANPRYIRARIGLYRTYQAMGRPGDVVREIDALLAQGPRFPDVILDRGKALMELGRLDDAAADFDLSLQLNPNREAGYFLWAELEQKRGDISRAVEILRLGLTRLAQAEETARLQSKIADLESGGKGN